MSSDQDKFIKPVSFRRRLSAVAYDLIAIIALLFFTTLPIVIGFNRDIAPGNPFYFIYQLAVAFFYFGFCWTRSGQTLGMVAWKIRLVSTEGSGRVRTPAALLRFLVATSSLGLSLLSALFRPDRMTWHDRLSQTRLEHVRSSE